MSNYALIWTQHIKAMYESLYLTAYILPFLVLRSGLQHSEFHHHVYAQVQEQLHSQLSECVPH